MTQEKRNFAVDDQYVSDRFMPLNTLPAETEIFLGLHKNPSDYLSEIVWFKDGVDLSITEFEPDALSISREEVTSDMAIAQTTGTVIESWEVNPVIQANEGSAFLNFLKIISMNEAINNTRGKKILAYANGGIWYRKVHTFNRGLENEYVIEEVYPYVKASSWINPFSGKTTTETTYEFALLVETYPNTYYRGNVDKMAGVPAGSAPIEITHGTVTCTPTTFTIPTLDMTDSDMLAMGDSNGDLFVILYDKDGKKICEVQSLGDGTDLVIPGTYSTKVYYEIFWLLDTDTKMPREGFGVTVTTTP